MLSDTARNVLNLKTCLENNIKNLEEENSALHEQYKTILLFENDLLQNTIQRNETTLSAMQMVLEQFHSTVLELNSDYEKEIAELQRCHDEEIKSILMKHELEIQTRKRKLSENESNNNQVQTKLISLEEQENFFSSKYLEQLHQEEDADRGAEISYLQDLDNETEDASAKQKPFKDVTNLSSPYSVLSEFIQVETPKSEPSIKRRKLLNLSDDVPAFHLQS